MSHGIDPAMKANEDAVRNTGADHPLRQADLLQLPPSHDPVLTPRQRGDPSVKDVRVEFWSPRDRESTRVFHAADAGEEMRAGGAQFVPT